MTIGSFALLVMAGVLAGGVTVGNWQQFFLALAACMLAFIAGIITC